MALSLESFIAEAIMSSDAKDQFQRWTWASLPDVSITQTDTRVQIQVGQETVSAQPWLLDDLYLVAYLQYLQSVDLDEESQQLLFGYDKFRNSGSSVTYTDDESAQQDCLPCKGDYLIYDGGCNINVYQDSLSLIITTSEYESSLPARGYLEWILYMTWYRTECM